ncbi:hypothetical protein DIE07_32300 [Burkholderia sp. Bp9002]|nr:hypothetical protein DIE07_32300 [Burkholderia sp. Bp9002]
MPTEWIGDERIRHFKWSTDGSAGTAALMLFFVLCHFVSERRARSTPTGPAVDERLESVALAQASPVEPNRSFVALAAEVACVDLGGAGPATVEMVAHLTYEDFGDLTGLSRKSISAGLKLLEERGMMRRCGSTRASDYHLNGLEPFKRWAKLPGQALLSPAKTSFLPLTQLGLRSRHELNALKLHFYYASVRDGNRAFSECTFETINKKTGVAERDIPRANSILLTVGLLSRYRREQIEVANDVSYTANRYYMEGYETLFKKKTEKTAASMATAKA